MAQQFNPAGIQKSSKYSTGVFQLQNPEKYIGDRSKCIWRSSWEKDFMFTCDLNPAVIQWAAEPFSIPYYNPVTRKNAQYWPDFIVAYMKKDGHIHYEVIEIKPSKQTVTEKAKAKADKLALAVNQAKWAAASSYCKSKGLTFRILTEEMLYRKK